MTALAFTAGTAAPAWAQTNLGPADPGRIEQRVTPPDMGWQRLEQAPARPQATPMTPDGAADIHFTLQSLSIEGMSAYSPADMAPFYKDYIGQEISVATLFDIMGRVQQKYLDDGYTLTKVFIPNQNIEGGHAKLLVIEGYVAEVELGDGLNPSPVIEDARRQILAMHPLNTIRLERLLLIMNDLPDLHVSAILATIKDERPADIPSGAVRLVLQPGPKAYSYGEISVDNYGSVFAGPYQGRVIGRVPHIGTAYSELRAMALASTSFQEQKFASLNYERPLFGVSGTNLVLGATTARTEPGSNLDILDVKGRSQSISAQIKYALIKQRAKNLVIDAGIDFKNSYTKLLGDRLYDDRQRILNAGFSYSFSDSLYGLNLFDVHYAQGFNILGVREKGSVDLSRLDGRPDFKKFNFAAGRLQALPHNFEAYLMVAGQYAFDPLLSSEEFGFGGEHTGRGYNPSELAGDRGISSTLMLRYKGVHTKDGWNLAYQPYVFFDIGKVWNIDFNDTTHMSGASAGTGLKLNLNNQWDSDLALAWPLTRPAQNPPKYADEYGPRVLFSLTRKF